MEPTSALTTPDKDLQPGQKVGEYVIYEPNDKYQGSATALFDKLTMKAIEGVEAQVTELRQGTIAGCWPNDFSLEIMQPLDDQPELKYEVYAGATWSHFDMNVNNAFLKDVALRQAVFTTIDIEEIKARGMEAGYGSPIGARDAIVVVDGDVLGKPTDPDDAVRLLQSKHALFAERDVQAALGRFQRPDLRLHRRRVLARVGGYQVRRQGPGQDAGRGIPRPPLQLRRDPAQQGQGILPVSQT